MTITIPCADPEFSSWGEGRVYIHLTEKALTTLLVVWSQDYFNFRENYNFPRFEGVQYFPWRGMGSTFSRMGGGNCLFL